MSVKHLLSITNLGSEQISQLVDRALVFAYDPSCEAKPLSGKTVGIYFRGSSTRTRTAFIVAAMRLGANTIAYGPSDLQLVTGETIEDTARVLSGFIDALVIRDIQTVGEMEKFARQDEMAIINAMSNNEHPTQAIADLVTIREALGRLEGVHVLYLGEGNNSAASLALAVSLTQGMRLTLMTPEGYGLPQRELQIAQCLAEQHNSLIEQHHDINKLPKGVEVVYTTRWQTMGVPKAEANWRAKFEPYGVTARLMARVSKPEGGTIFLHDLPAVRGADVDDLVLDGPQSVAFRQAKHKLTSAMAVLEWCVTSA